MSADRKPGFNTLAIHAGAHPDPATGARATPIYQTTSYRVRERRSRRGAVQPRDLRQHLYAHHEPDPGRARGARRGLGGRHGRACRGLRARGAGARLPRCCSSLAMSSSPRASSMAARSTSSPSPSRNSTGTCALPTPTMRRASARRSRRRPRRSSSSSIANPGGIITDIAAVSAVAKEAGVPLIVDNTLATPYLIRPIEHGADIIVHSLTKFLGGHGNSIGGAIVDCGTFDWMKSGRYPTLSEPSPSYHGVTFAETFGNFAFAIACPRLLVARSRPCHLAVQRLPHPHRHRDAAACACSGIATTRSPWRSGCRATTRSPG